MSLDWHRKERKEEQRKREETNREESNGRRVAEITNKGPETELLPAGDF